MITTLMLAAALADPALQPADVPPPTYLWPDGAPGAVGDEEADKPCLFMYPAPDENNTGAAVVLSPGGGYAVHAMDHEGHHIARFLQSRGITVGVLRYRLGERYRHPAPLQDVSRAIRMTRHHAAKWSIDPNRVGAMGFSAGGHLTSTVSTHYDAGDAESDDPIERQSSRPSFTVLGYPVVSLTASYRHKGSGRRLLGPDATDDQLNELSNDLHVTPDTPPAFLFHTAGDTGVPAQNSLAYAMACANSGVPCEVHLFRYGPHGVGMALADPAASQWRDLLVTWMRQSGFLTDKPRRSLSGTVTYNGRPIASGEIAYIPDDSNAPTPATRIGGGKFKFDATTGPTPGRHTVEIRHNGGVKPGPTVETPVVVKRLEIDIRPAGSEVDTNYVIEAKDGFTN